MATAIDTDLCNEALGFFGKETLNDVETDTSVGAIQCRRFYLRQLKLFQTMHKWSYLITKATIAKDDAASILPQYLYSYPLPADFLNVYRVVETSGTDTSQMLDRNFNPTDYSADTSKWTGSKGFLLPPVNYVVAAGKLHTNFTPLDLIYYKYDTSVSIMPEPVRQAFAWALANLLVLPVTRDVKKAERVTAQAEKAFNAATAHLDFDTLTEDLKGSAMEEARRY